MTAIDILGSADVQGDVGDSLHALELPEQLSVLLSMST